MKAIQCNAFGAVENLVLTNVDNPVPDKGEVVINIEAAGVNFPDGLLVQGLYQLKPATPFIPGSEVAGRIASLGEGVTSLQIGQRVIAFCMLGGFAQQVKINAHMVMPLQDNIPAIEAAGLLSAHATAHHGLRQRANLQSGETLLVTGAGSGTGLAAVQIGKAIGAKVIAVGSSEAKLAIAKESGADILINHKEQHLKTAIKEATNGQGVDVVYECIGGDTFSACLSNVAWNGRVLVVGFAGGEIPKVPVNLALVKGCSIVGVFWGTFTQKQPKLFAKNMKELLAWYQEGKVKVIVDEVFPLPQTVQAINKLLNQNAVGKVIIQP